MNIRTLCLGILSRGDATGYEIKKMAEEGLFSHFIEASFGSIYPALKKLEEEGLIRMKLEIQENAPNRKVYTITEAGKQTFLNSLKPY